MVGYMIAGVAALALALLVANVVATANPAKLAQLIRSVAALVLCLLGIALLFARRFELGLPLLGLAWALFLRKPVRGFGPAGSNTGSRGGGAGQSASGRTSSVRSRYFEMRLDQSSGEMTGVVLDGREKGRELDTLSRDELLALASEVSGDPDSLSLLEVYLDRRFPGWREDVKSDAGARSGGATHSGAMSEEEAYEVLGLSPGATGDDIRAAHRQLMKRVHPDRGGSAFLAAKINQAKDRLLHRE